MKIKCYDIIWDYNMWQEGLPKGFYSMEQVLDALPKVITLEFPTRKEKYSEIEIADGLTGLTGFLVEWFSHEILLTDEPETKFKAIGPWHQKGGLDFRGLRENVFGV